MDERVGFTAMKDGTKEDYELLARLEKPFLALTAERVLGKNETLCLVCLFFYRTFKHCAGR